METFQHSAVLYWKVSIGHCNWRNVQLSSFARELTVCKLNLGTRSCVTNTMEWVYNQPEDAMLAESIDFCWGPGSIFFMYFVTYAQIAFSTRSKNSQGKY